MEETLSYIEIELYRKNDKDYVFLSNDGSSGVKKQIKSIDELKKIVADYVAEVYEENK